MGLLHHVKAFFYLAKDGVHTVKVGSAAVDGIDFSLPGRQAAGFRMLGQQLVREKVELPRAETPSPNDVILGTAAPAFRIGRIAFSGCRQDATLVIQATPEFGL